MCFNIYKMNSKEFIDYKNKELLGENSHKYLGYNNVYTTFPPIMNDSRLMDASWQPNSYLNKNLIINNNIENNWQYRQYLINNGNNIREYNFDECLYEMGANKSINYFETSGNKVHGDHNSPYLYKSILDNSMPFGSTSGDLQSIYLTRHQLDARKIAPSINQEELLKYKR